MRHSAMAAVSRDTGIALVSIDQPRSWRNQKRGERALAGDAASTDDREAEAGVRAVISIGRIKR